MAIGESALRLLRDLELGREEYCQRLLTMLILNGPYPRWNSRNAPSPRGRDFLLALDGLSFGTEEWATLPSFVDEFDLPRRHDGEAGAAPDYAVLFADRLWIIELKAAASSHRPAQIPTYLRLARHHHPARSIDLTYLTPEMTWTPPKPTDARLAHITRRQVVPLLTKIWSNGDSSELQALTLLTEAIEGIGKGRPPEPPKTGRPADPDPLRSAVQLAEATGQDGHQRALDHAAASVEELQRLRLAVKETIGAAPAGEAIRFVQAWIWTAATSTGQALTGAGESTGYELRLSRYRSDHY
jgi:hypothetical protein